AVDLELPERIAVLGGPLRAVDAHVPAGAGHVEGLHATGTGGRAVDGRPGTAVGRRLDLEGLRVRRLPVEHDLGNGRGDAEVDLQPLRIAERAGPAGAGVAVGGVGG